MARYYVNKTDQANGDHEVHKQGCNWMPADTSREYLGDFASCHGAITEAKRYGYSADGCYYCCTPCHKS